MLKYAAAAPAALSLSALANSVCTATASADSLGILLDYSAGVLSAADIKSAGALGAIRYVSDRRPGASWMLGKPMLLAEAQDLYQAGLKIASNYQYGKADTADWLGGQAAGIKHAKRGVEIHTAAGGPASAPIYVSIDDNPTYEQYKQQVVPYLRAWEEVLDSQRVGIYANSKTIEWENSAHRFAMLATSTSAVSVSSSMPLTVAGLCVRDVLTAGNAAYAPIGMRIAAAAATGEQFDVTAAVTEDLPYLRERIELAIERAVARG